MLQCLTQHRTSPAPCLPLPRHCTALPTAADGSCAFHALLGSFHRHVMHPHAGHDWVPCKADEPGATIRCPNEFVRQHTAALIMQTLEGGKGTKVQKKVSKMLAVELDDLLKTPVGPAAAQARDPSLPADLRLLATQLGMDAHDTLCRLLPKRPMPSLPAPIQQKVTQLRERVLQFYRAHLTTQGRFMSLGELALISAVHDLNLVQLVYDGSTPAPELLRANTATHESRPWVGVLYYGKHFTRLEIDSEVLQAAQKFCVFECDDLS